MLKTRKILRLIAMSLIGVVVVVGGTVSASDASTAAPAGLFGVCANGNYKGYVTFATVDGSPAHHQAIPVTSPGGTCYATYLDRRDSVWSIDVWGVFLSGKHTFSIGGRYYFKPSNGGVLVTLEKTTLDAGKYAEASILQGSHTTTLTNR